MINNPFTQPLRKTMNDAGFDWVRPQAMRRKLVASFIALIAALPILSGLTGSVWVLVLMLVPFVFVMGAINASIRGLTELRARDLDEREDRVRNRVYAQLYWPGVLLSFAAAYVLASFQTIDNLLVGASGLSLFFIAIALPALWLAWTLPDEPEAD